MNSNFEKLFTSIKTNNADINLEMFMSWIMKNNGMTVKEIKKALGLKIPHTCIHYYCLKVEMEFKKLK